jgi:hypothetical protein
MNYFEACVVLGQVDQHCSSHLAARRLRQTAWDARQELIAHTTNIEDEGDRAYAQHVVHGSAEYVTAQEQIWLGLTTMANSATNLYKFLYNNKGGESLRAEARALLNMPNAEPEQVRRVRNRFEHLDEDLFQHLESEAAAMTADPGRGRIHLTNLVVEGSISSLPGSDRVFGYWDASTDTLVYWAKKVDLRVVTADVERISAAVEPALATVAAREGIRSLR